MKYEYYISLEDRRFYYRTKNDIVESVLCTKDKCGWWPYNQVKKNIKNVRNVKKLNKQELENLFIELI